MMLLFWGDIYTYVYIYMCTHMYIFLKSDHDHLTNHLESTVFFSPRKRHYLQHTCKENLLIYLNTNANSSCT